MVAAGADMAAVALAAEVTPWAAASEVTGLRWATAVSLAAGSLWTTAVSAAVVSKAVALVEALVVLAASMPTVIPTTTPPAVTGISSGYAILQRTRRPFAAE